MKTEKNTDLLLLNIIGVVALITIFSFMFLTPATIL